MSRKQHKDKISCSRELFKGVQRLTICKNINFKQLRINSDEMGWSCSSIMKSLRNVKKSLNCLDIDLQK